MKTNEKYNKPRLITSIKKKKTNTKKKCNDPSNAFYIFSNHRLSKWKSIYERNNKLLFSYIRTENELFFVRNIITICFCENCILQFSLFHIHPIFYLSTYFFSLITTFPQFLHKQMKHIQSARQNRCHKFCTKSIKKNDATKKHVT